VREPEPSRPRLTLARRDLELERRAAHGA